MKKFMIRLAIGIHIFLFRISGSKIGNRIARLDVLLLTTKGSKTGKPRTIPLGYLEDNSDYVIIASSGGSEKHPAWFFNLKSNPQVTIEVKGKAMQAIAEPAVAENRKRLWSKLIEVAPLYERYQRRTAREIPLVLLHPISKM